MATTDPRVPRIVYLANRIVADIHRRPPQSRAIPI